MSSLVRITRKVLISLWGERSGLSGGRNSFFWRNDLGTIKKPHPRNREQGLATFLRPL